MRTIHPSNWEQMTDEEKRAWVKKEKRLLELFALKTERSIRCGTGQDGTQETPPLSHGIACRCDEINRRILSIEKTLQES